MWTFQISSENRWHEALKECSEIGAPTADVQPGGGAMGGTRRLEGVDLRRWLRTPPEEEAVQCVGEGEGHATIVKLKLLQATMVEAKPA